MIIITIMWWLKKDNEVTWWETLLLNGPMVDLDTVSRWPVGDMKQLEGSQQSVLCAVVLSCVVLLLSGSVFRGHQPKQLRRRLQRQDVRPAVHPERHGACEWILHHLTMRLCVHLSVCRRHLLVVNAPCPCRPTPTTLCWLLETQRGATWRDVRSWAGSPTTSMWSTTW